MEVDGLKPRAEPRIVNLRRFIPEAGIEATLNLQMIEEQFNLGGFERKVATNIQRADLDASQFPPHTMRFDDHLPTSRCRLLPEETSL